VLVAKLGQKDVQEKHSSLFGCSISDFEKNFGDNVENFIICNLCCGMFVDYRFFKGAPKSKLLVNIRLGQRNVQRKRSSLFGRTFCDIQKSFKT
jgi:hypothetical protein